MGKRIDLSAVIVRLEAAIMEELELTERPAMALALTLPPEYERVHWITNVSRQQGVEIFEQTALKMRAEVG